MRYSLLWPGLVSGVALTVASCAMVSSQPSNVDVNFTVLHTNDHHGRFWKNSRGEYGLAARKTLVDNLRAEIEGQGEYVFLFSGGDINAGVPESDMQDAGVDITA